MSNPTWRKSSHSASNGTCVELAEWRKASFSNQGDECVELAQADDVIAVRDSKLGDDSPILEFTRAELRAFMAGVKAGEFDDLA